MNYKLLAINDEEVSHEDLQKRPAWYSHGEKKEETFTRKYGEK